MTIFKKLKYYTLYIMRISCSKAHDICKSMGFRHAAIRCDDGWLWCTHKIHDMLMGID